MTPLTGRALVAAMCLGQVGGLLPHVAVPAIMAQHLMPLWGLSAAQAALVAGAYGFGFLAAGAVVTTLAGRRGPRSVAVGGGVVRGRAMIMFCRLAHACWLARLIWALSCVGFAGDYIPGLKAFAGRLPL